MKRHANPAASTKFSAARSTSRSRICSPDKTELEVEILSYKNRLAVLPSTHPLAVPESLTFDDLKDARFICNPATANGILRSAQGLGSQRRRAAWPGLTRTATSLAE
jgi:hypothetical protein